ncbi:hypothetical protein [uncultured Psychroserpens sp.]|uniref:hypothetical protein n=1 Tax=uncultured Psychroserpens sp. TaxID=255436 RepID=UPI00260556AD|nr:hypothetical protein [uncultured Psychroserpens sp.]
MASKILIKSIFLLCITLSFTNLQAQQHEVELLGLETIQFSTINNDDVYYYTGQIRLKDQQTFNGLISINHKRYKDYTTILKTKDKCVYIPNENIDTVILYKDDNRDYTETTFVSIKGHDKLFREIYKKDNSTIVYDLLKKPFDGKIMNDIYIKENGKLVSIFNFWSSGPKKDLINYINKRDTKTYKRRDFKSLKDLFAKL